MKKDWQNQLFRMGFGKFMIPQVPAGTGFSEENKNLVSWLLQLAFENKVNVVECYSEYDQDEYNRIIGQTIHPYRDDIFLIDRISVAGMTKPGDLYNQCMKDMELLQTSYIDCVSMEHFPAEFFDEEGQPTEVINVLLDDVKRLVAEDAIHISGFMGFHDPDHTAALIDYAQEYGAPFGAILCEYNLINQHMSYSLAVAKRRGLTTFALSAVGNERLTHELSFRFVWSNRNVDVLMTQTLSESRLYRNLEIEHTYQGVVAAPEKSMWSHIAKSLEGVRTIYHSECGMCTACEPCPLGIPIVDWLNLCRDYLRESDTVHISRQVERFFLEHGNPVEICNHCKKCEHACPQQLPITSFMRKAALSKEMWKDYITY